MQLQHPPVFMQINFIIKVSFFSCILEKRKKYNKEVLKKKTISKLAI